MRLALIRRIRSLLRIIFIFLNEQMLLWLRRNAVRRRRSRMMDDEDEDGAELHCHAQRLKMMTRSGACRRWYSVNMLPPRRCWEFPRSCDWWTNFVMSVWDDERWIKHFRMSRETLSCIAQALRPRIRRQSTAMRKPVPVFKRVAMCVWWLANVASYRELSEQFGVGISTAAEIVVEVCLAMELDLLKKYVRLGNVKKVIEGFERLGFPNCVGAIDGTLIRIIAPPRSFDGYIDRKSFHSMVMQGTVDHTGRFTNVCVGWSGRHHDSHVFRNSFLCETMDKGVFVPGNPSITIRGVLVPPIIVGDKAYPLKRWLMKPYGSRADQRKYTFDMRLSACRNVVECAFGRLKARWRCLTSRLQVSIQNVIPVITACVILHNICEERKHGVVSDEGDPPIFELGYPEAHTTRTNARDMREGEEVRNALTDFFWEGEI